MAERPRKGTLLAGIAALLLAGQAPPQDAAGLVAAARADLARGDGIAAEVRLKQALAVGARREAVAAMMGEALLDQGAPAKAREWLAPGQFSADQAAYGFRMLGRLEHAEGNLPASAAAYDRAIALTPDDPLLWVDIGRLRYAGGEQRQALDAVDHALTLDPGNLRAIEFKGQFVRDQFGLNAALVWFEAGLQRDPGDLGLLGEYAATLGDLGRAGEMLAVTRRMMEQGGANPRALLLLAQLAARAGDAPLARSLLNRAGTALDRVPAKLLLDGVIELNSDNHLLASEALEKLVAMQPANREAQALLARARYAAGEYRVVVERFGPLAARADALVWLLITVARAHEALGRRDLAVPLLERARDASDRPFAAVPENRPVGALLAEQRNAEAAATAARQIAAQPGSAAFLAQAGDVELTLGRAEAALERYRAVAAIRMPESLLLRMVAALGLAGQPDAASALVAAYLAQNPQSRVAARLAAAHAAATGDWTRAGLLLAHLRDTGGDQDPRLLAELAMAQLRAGDAVAAEASARTAYGLQPSSPVAARAWAAALEALKQRPNDVRALLRRAG